MSYLLTTCVAFTVIRMLEQFFMYIYSFVFRKKEERKESKSLNPEYRRLTVNITPELYDVIKKHCISSGVTMTQYTFRAVVALLKQENVL